MALCLARSVPQWHLNIHHQLRFVNNLPFICQLPSPSRIANLQDQMHQDHNIPWNTLISHLRFIPDHPHITPRRTDLFPRHKPTQSQQVNYFVKAFTKVVEEFAETERAKWPKTFKDFAGSDWDETRERLIAGHPTVDPSLIRGISTFPEDAQGVVTALEGTEMEILLAFANLHPRAMACGHNESLGRAYVLCGWVQYARYSIRAYIFFNVVAGIATVRNDEQYKQMESYKRLWRDLTRDSLLRTWDKHLKFLAGVESVEWKWDVKNGGHAPKLQGNGVDVFEDYEKLQEYLKYCFSCLYKYLALARECGLGHRWEPLVRDTVFMLWGLKAEDDVQVDGQQV